MSNEFDYDDRQLIPRLLPFRTANVLSLNQFSTEPDSMNALEAHNFSKLISEWKTAEKNIDTGISILSYKLIFNSIVVPEDVDNFIERKLRFLNQSQLELYNLYRNKAHNVGLDCNEHVNVAKEIQKIRTSNKASNRNPILWCDLGYYYTTLGLTKQATKCYLVALGLNNHNRHVLRSASRFFLHIDEPGRAINILRRSPNIKNDVGLLSAEIAISELEGKKSRFIDYGKIKLEDENISIYEKNELLAQVASLEFSYGKNRLAKEYVEKCLVMPNENSLAQFEFLRKNIHIDGKFSSHDYDVLCKHEALARAYYLSNKYEEAVKEVTLWGDFQPFSSLPACYGSYIASTLLEDHEKSIQILGKALKVSPGDFTLLNNYAFALASLNRETEAFAKLNLIDTRQLEPSEQAVFNATMGLIRIKEGNVSEGKMLYEKAINYFSRSKEITALLRAKYHYGRALIKIDYKQSQTLISEVYEVAKRINFNDLMYAIDKFRKVK